MGKRRNVCVVIAGKTEVKRPFGRPRVRYEDIIKCLKEMECGGM
jgi:hypothetical protein